MEIISKTVEIDAIAPLDNHFIDRNLKKMGIDPLRWAIVKVQGSRLTVNVAHQNLV